MQNVKISLVDSDFVVRAKADLVEPENKSGIMDLIRHLGEDFIQGEDAYLEIDGFGNSRNKYIISRVEV